MPSPSTSGPPIHARQRSTVVWVGLAAVLALALFVSTLQVGINGSESAYATDAGEIQNALPRWGTIHFTGYPLYTASGSLMVTLFRLLGIAPAAGASLVSALWGAVAVGALALLACTVGAPGPVALLASLLAAVSLSTWIDASLAEIHTLSMAFTTGSLWLALRFGRTGARRDLLWFAAVATQGVAHQRALAFLAPALLVLVWPQRRVIWRYALPVVAISLLAPLSYLYLPWRYWQGSDWTFGQTGTWQGFTKMILDTKADRIIALPGSAGEWLARAGLTANLLAEDLPLPLAGLGFLGLVWPCAARLRARPSEEVAAPNCAPRESLGLLLAALPYLGLCLIIWEGRVSDALLAAKLPAIHLAALGLAMLAGALVRALPRLRWVPMVALALPLLLLTLANRPQVLAITRDPRAEEVIATAAAAARAGEATPGHPITLMALWGHDYWALAYASEYRSELPGLTLVDHNAHFEAIVASGERLWTLDKTFYALPPDWWAQRLGPISLSSVFPGVIEIAPQPATPTRPPSLGPAIDLGNGIEIVSAQLERAVAPRADGTTLVSEERLVVSVYWRAQCDELDDYAVAVHLLAANPPAGPEDLLGQADAAHPIGGWYPTSTWRAGEVVRDDYVIPLSDGRAPIGVRLGMYQVGTDGGFTNTEWLFLPLS